MSENEFQKQVLERLEKLDKLDRDVEHLSRDNEKFNDRFTNYQQATQSLVSLAFGLIASATVITVVSAVFKR
jgi:hypothetical protein